MYKRFLVSLILGLFCWFNVLASETLNFDSLKYHFKSEYSKNHPLETIIFFDSLLHVNLLNEYEKRWVLYNKGQVLFLNYEYLEALNSFKDAQKVTVNNGISNRMIYNAIAECHEEMFHYLEAEKFYYLSLGELSIYDTTHLGALYNAIGRVNYSAGIYDKAVKYLIKSNNISNRLSDTSTYLSSSINLGIVYAQWGQNEKAIQVYNRALKFCDEAICLTYKGMLLSNIGVSYFDLKEYHLALTYYERALKIEQMLESEYDISGSYHNIGNVYEVLGDYDKALNYYLRAINIQNRIDDYEGLVLTSHDIGIVYDKLGDTDLAIEYVNKSLLMCEKYGFVRTRMNVFETLAMLMSKKGEFNKAYAYQLEFNLLKDSLFSSDKNREIAEQQARFDSEHQKVEIELLSKEKEINDTKIYQHRIIIISFSVLVFLMLGALIIIFRALSLKRKANEKLREKEKQIVEITNKVLKQNDDLIDNLQYGKVIQKAVLAGKTNLDNWFADNYFISKPYMIVSGDFFWTKNIGNKLYVVMADCTGHGVPGGFMSMLGVAFLNDLVGHEFKYYPNNLLDELRDRVKFALNQSDFETKTQDGMDLACCLFDFDTQKLFFSGAHMSVWHQSKVDLKKYKGDLNPIGVSVKEKPFSLLEGNFKADDRFYMFTDGVVDQLNAEGCRYSNKRLEKLLIESKNYNFAEQKVLLKNEFAQWKSDSQQTDDSLFLGLKI